MESVTHRQRSQNITANAVQLVSNTLNHQKKNETTSNQKAKARKIAQETIRKNKLMSPCPFSVGARKKRKFQLYLTQSS